MRRAEKTEDETSHGPARNGTLFHSFQPHSSRRHEKAHIVSNVVENTVAALNFDLGSISLSPAGDLSSATSRPFNLAPSPKPSTPIPLSPYTAHSHSSNQRNILDMLGPCLASYWHHVWPVSPVIHKHSFSEALTAPSGIWGTNPPYALLFGMAALGVWPLDDTSLSHSDRYRLSRTFCEAARDMVFAGHLDHMDSPTPNPRMSDLEAMLTVFMVYVAMAQAGLVRGGRSALTYAAQTLSRLLVRHDSLQLHKSFPPDPDTWIISEITLRFYIVFSSTDASSVYWGHKQPLFDFYNGLFPLPSSELYFMHHDSCEAYAALRSSLEIEGSPCWPTIDFDAFAENPTIEGAHRLAAEFAAPVFEHRGSALGVFLQNSFLRHTRGQMRTLVQSRNLDTVAMMGKNPEEYTPDEAEYRTLVSLFDALIEGTFSAIPGTLGLALTSGDSRTLLYNFHAYFPHPGPAHLVLTMLMALRSLPMEHYLAIDPPGGVGVFFGAPEFLRILESTVLYSRLLDGKLEADPEVAWSHHVQVLPATRVGAFLLAVIKILRSGAGPDGLGDTTGLAEDVRAIVRFLRHVGNRIGPAVATLAEDFAQSVCAAELSPEPDPRPRSPAIEDDEGPTDGLPLHFRVRGGSAGPCEVLTDVVRSAERGAEEFYEGHTTVVVGD